MDGFIDDNTTEYSLAEAAKLAGVSQSTLRRYRDKLTAVGAVLSQSGWKITKPQLAAVGLLGSVTPAPTDPSMVGGGGTSQNDDLDRRVRDLEIDNARLQATINGIEQRLEFAYSFIQQKLIEPPVKKHWWQR